MANRVALTTLNASTVDILNTIRANASYQYQSLVPQITQADQIPKVGEVVLGYPALANEFISTLINRIALVLTKSLTFNNPYVDLKKGYLEFGETVEEAFVGLTKARVYDPEKAPAREFKRTLPDVKTAFHVMNWKVMYPITIQEDELKRAFLSAEGVIDLVNKIVTTCQNASEYDEFLLMKYQLIKAISHGKMKAIAFDSTDAKNAAKTFRGTSNVITFPSSKYNEAGVVNDTQKADQYIFMDAQYNADYDVDVLASAFNMEKADFMGKLHLIDDFTTFDSDRFSEVMAESDGLETVTADELELMKDVKAVLIDKEWFQDYDNLIKFTEVNVTTGLYWNYNLHIWKTISHSPFSNAVVFVDDGATISYPSTLTAEIRSIEDYEGGKVMSLVIDDDNETLQPTVGNFVETEADVVAGIAVLPIGGFIIPSVVASVGATHIQFKMGDVLYKASASKTLSTAKVGDTITLNKQS